MPKKMPVSSLKKQLNDLSQQEMISLICKLYQSCPDTTNILNARFNGEDYVKGLLAESMEKIEKEFSGRGMKLPSLPKAKKVIADFEKVSSSPEDVLELKLHYVSSLTEFGRYLGDMPESFYNSLEKVYSDIVAGLNKLKSEAMFAFFYPKLRNIMAEAEDLGYDLSDNLSFVLEEKLRWKPENEKSK